MEKSILSIQQSVLISGLLIALALMIGTYTDRKDRRCDALINHVPNFLFWSLIEDDPTDRAAIQLIERLHGITFRECSARLK